MFQEEGDSPIGSDSESRKGEGAPEQGVHRDAWTGLAGGERLCCEPEAVSSLLGGQGSQDRLQ